MKICVLFGGASTESNVSIVSGTSVIEHLDKDKYEIYPVYIDKENNYYKYTKDINSIKMLDINTSINELEYIDNIIDYFKTMDVIFPVLHGKYGEDGTIQGLLELINLPYVGCNILSSSICMDKIYSKKLLDASGINTSKYIFIKKINNNYVYFDNNYNEYNLNDNELIKLVNDKLKYPVFVKPSRSGSSIGVSEANIDNIIDAVNEAFKYDDKVLIEEKIIGRELEVAVLGNETIEVTVPGEINNNKFYSYESKYIDKTGVLIPASIDINLQNKIKDIAKRAYKVCNCTGLSRVDFFLDKNNNIILNEINTMPGFTSISMYPKLMKYYGYSYCELLDKLIDLAIKKA